MNTFQLMKYRSIGGVLPLVGFTVDGGPGAQGGVEFRLNGDIYTLIGDTYSPSGSRWYSEGTPDKVYQIMFDDDTIWYNLSSNQNRTVLADAEPMIGFVNVKIRDPDSLQVLVSSSPNYRLESQPLEGGG